MFKGENQEKLLSDSVERTAGGTLVLSTGQE
jgi:hypothetical protein